MKTKIKLLRIAAFSDLHQTNSNRHYKTDSDGRSDLLKRQRQFIEYLSKLDVDLFLNLGDTTDEEIVNPYVMEPLNDLLLGSLAKTGKLCIHLEGNHCIVDGDNVYSILSSYKGKVPSNVKLTVDASSDILLEVEEKKIYIRSVPYMGDYAKMREQIVKPLDEPADFALLLYHAPTVNALMDNGLPATKGLSFEDDDLQHYNLALAGDFHKPQQFMVGQTEVHYVGAPFALTRGQNFDLGYRELTIYDDGSFELIHKKNPYAISIVDRTYEALNLETLHPESTVLYINDVKHEDKKAITDLLKDKSFYSFKLKMAPIKKSEVLDQEQTTRIEAHKKQDMKSLFLSVLSEEEKRDEWIQDLINAVTK